MKNSSCFILFLVIACACAGSLIAQTDAHRDSAQEGGTEERPETQTKKAVIKSKPAPEQQKQAGETEKKATVVLKAILRSYGKITDIKLVKVIPEDLPEDVAKDLVKSAIKAAKAIKFIPAMKDGHAVSQYVQIEYKFNVY